MDDASVLLLQNTSQLDRFELEKLAEPGVVEITEPTVDQKEHGELLTAGVLILLSAQGLVVLASWLNKRRKKEKLTIKATVRKSDGSEHEVTIDWTGEESEAAMPDQLKALSKMLDIKPPALPN